MLNEMLLCLFVLGIWVCNCVESNEPFPLQAGLKNKLPRGARATRAVERSIHDHFVSSFQRSCSKYRFVEQYWHLLEHPTEEIVEFVYSVKGSKEGDFGGVGDRFGGLISAVAMALRFKRTLVIEAEDEFYHFFRPHRYPGNIDKTGDVLTYRQLKSRYSNISRTPDSVVDLSKCINPEYTPEVYEHPHRIHACGLDHATPAELVGKSVISMRLNRCYLCKWMHNTSEPAREQLINDVGIQPTDNLYEVGGCMLRLAMWPTDLAITKVAELIVKFTSHETIDTATSKESDRNSWKTIPVKTFINESMHSVFPTANKALDTALLASSAARIVQKRGIAADGPPPPKPTIPFMIGLHFRCGDQAIKDFGNSKHCQWNLNGPNHPDTMATGTPMGSGMCAHVVANRIQEYINKSEAKGLLDRSELMFHVASDNLLASQQMAQFAANQLYANNVYMSPIGCHVDIDSGSSCQEDTLVHFVLLSLSRIMIMPLRFGWPSSGFSRLAAVYGLFANGNNGYNIILSPFDCVGGAATDTSKFGNITHGNFLCDDLFDVMENYRKYMHQKQANDAKAHLRQENKKLNPYGGVFTIAVGLVGVGIMLVVKFLIGSYVIDRCCPSLLQYRYYFLAIGAIFSVTMFLLHALVL